MESLGEVSADNNLFFDVEEVGHATSHNGFFGTSQNGFLGTDVVTGDDPLLQDVQNLDFRLQATSPLIDTGLGVVGILDDKDGAVRDGQPDIGAYEYVK